MTAEHWQVYCAGIVLVLTVIFKFVIDFYKIKRDRAESEEKLQALRDIAASNRQIREGQTAQNGKLSSIMLINEQYNIKILSALQKQLDETKTQNET